MEHLSEIEDWPTRNAIDAVQSGYEQMILDLLDDDADKAQAYLDTARDRFLHQIKNAGSDFIALDQQAQSTRIAIAIMEKSFERLLAVVRDAAHQEGPPAGEAE